MPKIVVTVTFTSRHHSSMTKETFDPIDVTDRFNTRFVVRRLDTGIELAYGDTDAGIGIDGLSIRNAVVLGFSTTEYHAAMG